MPMYDYQCKECLSITTRYRKMDERNNPLRCSNCQGDMKMAILSAPFATVQPEAHYLCPATGKEVTSWRQRKNLFAKHDLVEADPDRQQENMQKGLRRKAERDKLQKEYLPKDLREKLTKIGSTGDNKFHVG
jgi:putative FmdB family regulatory protein